MARTKKIGLEYFSIGVDLVNQIKIMKVIHAGGGLKTLGFYISLLSYIYQKGYYLSFDEDFCFLMSVHLKLSPENVQDLINECINVGLLDKNLYDNERILTSADIQRYYINIISHCKRKAQLDKYNLLSDNAVEKKKKKGCQNEPDLFGNIPNKCGNIPNVEEEKGINSEITPQNSEICNQSSQKSTRNIKENKRKENNNTTTTTTTHARKEAHVVFETKEDLSNSEVNNIALTGEHSDNIGNNLVEGDKANSEKGVKSMLMNLTEDWKEDVCGLYCLPREKLDELLTKFIQHCHSIDKSHTDENDFKRHFVSWLKIEINSSNNKQNSNEQQCNKRQIRQPGTANVSVYDRRRAAPIPVATAEDYKNSSF